MRLTWSNANTTNSTSLAWFLTTLYTHVRCLAFVLCFAFYPRLIWVVSNHFCIVVFHSGFPKNASGWLILHSSCMGQAYIGIYSAPCSRGRIEFSWFWTCYCFNVKSCPHSYSAHPVKPLSESVIYVLHIAHPSMKKYKTHDMYLSMLTFTNIAQTGLSIYLCRICWRLAVKLIHINHILLKVGAKNWNNNM